ncbi:MAG: T9SS C-terminal target domain-containing protein [Calditrichaeota bacterium]|nr:MAG: T9SS C-terminal target domain-containing protein [Calditrichota bacterium]
MSKFFIQIAFMLLIPSFVLSMTITSDTTWTSNQTLLFGATIKNGATLTINSGVKVTIGLNKGIFIENDSKLVAEGTSSNQIEFNTLLGSGSWKGLFFEKTAKHKMGNVKISNAKTGIFQDSTSSVVIIRGLEFDNCERGVVFNNTSSINGVIASRFNCSEFSILANKFTMIQNNLFINGDYGIVGDSLKVARIKNNTFVNVDKVLTNEISDSTYAFGSAIFQNNIVSNGSWGLDTTSTKFDSLYVISSCFHNTTGISQADSNLFKMFACIYQDPMFADTIDYKLTSNFDETNNDVFVGITSSPCIDKGTGDKDLIPTVPHRPESGIIISDESSNAYGEEIKFETLAEFSILPPNVPNSTFFTPYHNLGGSDFVYAERSIGSVLEEFVDKPPVTFPNRPEAQWGIIEVNPVYPINSFKVQDLEPFEETIIQIDDLDEEGIGNYNAQQGTFQTVITTRVPMSEFGTGAASEGSGFSSTNISHKDLSEFGVASTERFPFGKYPNMGHNGGLFEAGINISEVINGRSTSGNETWNGNIILKNDFIVSASDTLFIKEGTQVLITAQNGTSPSTSDEADANLVEVICKGTIVMVQDIDTNSTQPTIFKTNSSITKWYGIRFLSSSTDQNLNWAIIENAKIGVEIEDPNSATEFKIEDNLFVGFDDYALYSKENDLEISVSNNLFSNPNQSTSSTGIYLEGDTKADIEEAYLIKDNFFKNLNGSGIVVRNWAADLKLNLFHEVEAPIQLSGIEEELEVYGNLIFGAKTNAISIENSGIKTGGKISKNFYKNSNSMSALKGIYYKNSHVDTFSTNLIEDASYGLFMIDAHTNDPSVFEKFALSAGNDESSQFGIYVSQCTNPQLKFSENTIKNYAQGGYYFYKNADLELEIGDSEDSSPSIIQGEDTENRCVYGMYFANNTNTSSSTVKVRKVSTGYTNNAVFIKENNSSSLIFDLGKDCEEDLGNNSFYLSKSTNLIWNENSNIYVNAEGNFWGDSSGTLIQNVEDASKNFDLNCFLNLDPNEGSIPKISVGNFKGTFKLAQNYPNPFNPTTNIEFFVPSESNVKIEVFNILGQNVKTLTNSKLKAGSHAVTWNGTDNNSNLVGTGVYFYRISSENFKQTRKMLLIK